MAKCKGPASGYFLQHQWTSCQYFDSFISLTALCVVDDEIYNMNKAFEKYKAISRHIESEVNWCGTSTINWKFKQYWSRTDPCPDILLWHTCGVF